MLWEPAPCTLLLLYCCGTHLNSHLLFKSENGIQSILLFLHVRKTKNYSMQAIYSRAYINNKNNNK